MGLTRRRLLGRAGVAGAGIGLGAGGYLLGHQAAEASERAGTVQFEGAHQAGIATPAQDRLHFAAFDLTIDTKRELRDLLREWSAAAAQMTAGEAIGPEREPGLAPPADTGETIGLSPALLTITFGLGPGVFERGGADRLGLRSRKPSRLRPIPALPADALESGLSGGDLCVQACANDPQVAFHAIRDLARIGRGAVVMRWSQLGFGRTSSTTRSQSTPRNLMGFKDGTNNIKADDSDQMRRFVWLGEGDQPAWMRDGTFMVTRRIRMLLEIWDRSTLRDQQQTIGRRKRSGAPLTGEDEFDRVDLGEKQGAHPVIPTDAHIRLAAPSSNSGERILRRGYSFTDGVVEESGELDAGLFFICFQRDPERQFVAVQRRLGASDALNEYIQHTGSAVFAIPPGARPGGYVGETLLG
jgi:deferrochelatase/peroxidase EfeB